MGMLDNITREALSDLSPLTTIPIFALLLVQLQTKQKFCPDRKLLFRPEYDYIIVGAGTGGSTLAARLSEVPCVNVLLLEAGDCPISLTEIPAIGLLLVDTYIDWKFKTEPNEHAGKGYQDGRIKWPRGKMLGGTSNLNGHQYVRGNRQDYDDWANVYGAEGWSYDEVLPYFKKAEGNRDTELAPSYYHNNTGPLTIDRPNYSAEMKPALFEAFEKLGYGKVDCNGKTQIGSVDHQGMIRDGQRCSAAKAYLVPNEKRPNLDIVTNAYVTKIIIKDNKAVGVVFNKDLLTHTITANKEVLISAGTIKTPQLLMLSGIGPKEHLESMEIPVVADLPVGNNLHDHVGVLMGYEHSGDIQSFENKITDANNVYEYYTKRSGVLSSMAASSIESFVNAINSSNTSGVPDIQIYIAEGQSQGVQKVNGFSKEVYDQVWKPYEGKTIAVCMSIALDPKSRGTVRLRSRDPTCDPVLDPNYLADPGDLDKVVNAMKICDYIGKSEPMKTLGYKPFTTKHPGCENLKGDAYFKCVARLVAGTVHHQVGTAKMGCKNDPSTVVDPELKVKGIVGLRVVDASVMPKVISGNTNTPVVMIAEKATDMIKETLTCPTIGLYPRRHKPRRTKCHCSKSDS